MRTSDEQRDRAIRLMPTIAKLWDKWIINEEGNMAFSSAWLDWVKQNTDEEVLRLEQQAASIPFDQLCEAEAHIGDATMPEELSDLFDSWWE